MADGCPWCGGTDKHWSSCPDIELSDYDDSDYDDNAESE